MSNIKLPDGVKTLQIKEEDLLKDHIICPKTRDFKTLKYLQNLGYTLYFMDHKNYLCRLRLLPKPIDPFGDFHM